MEVYQRGLFDRERGLELASNGEWRNGLKNRQWRTTVALRGNMVDSNLVVRELEIPPNDVDFTQTHVVAVVHIGFDP